MFFLLQIKTNVKSSVRLIMCRSTPCLKCSECVTADSLASGYSFHKVVITIWVINFSDDSLSLSVLTNFSLSRGFR